MRPPLEIVATALQDLIDASGVVPLVLTLAVLVSGGWLLRGRYGAAVVPAVYADPQRHPLRPALRHVTHPWG